MFIYQVANSRGGLNIYNELNGDCYTALWKNGIKQNLNGAPGKFWYVEDHDNFLRINKNGDVFVMGKSGDYNERTIWKNGTVMYTFLQIRDLYDLYVQGNDVYVLGSDTSYTQLYPKRLWKNGVPQTIPAVNTYPSSVLVTSNSDVYIGMGNGKLFKNNVEQPLQAPTGSIIGTVVDIFEEDGNIYALGSRGTSFPYKSILWKNGIQLYELNYSKATNGIDVETIFVSGSDVYVYGSVTYNRITATNTSSQDVIIWKNGEVFKTLKFWKTCTGVIYAPSIFVK